MHVSIWLSYKKEILISVADLKFIKETCRFKKKFQYFLRSSTIPCVSLKIELFHLFEFFIIVHISNNVSLKTEDKTVHFLKLYLLFEAKKSYQTH